MANAFVTVRSLFAGTGRSSRWVNDSCRAGRIAGAIKIGAAWFIRADAVVDVGGGGTPSMPTVDAATADLRARGIL